MGYLLVQSDRIENTTAVFDDTQFMSDWNTYDTLYEGKKHNNMIKQRDWDGVEINPYRWMNDEEVDLDHQAHKRSLVDAVDITASSHGRSIRRAPP